MNSAIRYPEAVMVAFRSIERVEEGLMTAFCRLTFPKGILGDRNPFPDARAWDSK